MSGLQMTSFAATPDLNCLSGDSCNWIVTVGPIPYPETFNMGTSVKSKTVINKRYRIFMCLYVLDKHGLKNWRSILIYANICSLSTSVCAVIGTKRQKDVFLDFGCRYYGNRISCKKHGSCRSFFAL
jgi:hypothetical protein